MNADENSILHLLPFDDQIPVRHKQAVKYHANRQNITRY